MFKIKLSPEVERHFRRYVWASLRAGVHPMNTTIAMCVHVMLTDGAYTDELPALADDVDTEAVARLRAELAVAHWLARGVVEMQAAEADHPSNVWIRKLYASVSGCISL